MYLFAAYDTATGRILRITSSLGPVTGMEEFIQVASDFSQNDVTHYVKDGSLKSYPESANSWALFDYTSEVWFDPRTADDLYDEAQAYVRAFRDAVNIKRTRIITDGTDISITGHGLVSLQGRPEDQTSLQGLAFGAQLRLGMGDSSTLMNFLDRENVLHQLVPMQMLELWQKGAGFVSAIYALSWTIKEMNPETTNIEDPLLWTPGGPG